MDTDIYVATPGFLDPPSSVKRFTEATSGDVPGLTVGLAVDGVNNVDIFQIKEVVY